MNPTTGALTRAEALRAAELLKAAERVGLLPEVLERLEDAVWTAEALDLLVRAGAK